ncbi:MAG: porin [Calditerrivibrio sp.]|nr:porin [Calditerrivibrio sp.]MCA1980927.1 porin [Calditerrivibrio sp.]
MKKLIALLAMGLISASAFAAQWDMYGQVRLRAFYESLSKDYTGNATGETDTDLSFGNQANSRIGAKVKADDKLSAVVELGLGSSENGNNAVTTRLIYADYNFGAFKLRMGQDYGPTATFFDFNQVSNTDNDLVGFGAINSSRYAQLKLMAGGLEVAISKPGVNLTGAATYDVMLPRIEAAYTLDMKPIKAKIAGGYQTFKAYQNANETGADGNISAYVLAALVKVDMGAIYANATGYLGSNTGTMGYQGSASGINSTAAASFSEDSSDYGFALNAGFKASDSLILEAGYGYAQADRDDYTKADKAQSYYVNATYKIAKNFFIVPEISVEDRMKNKNDTKEGSKTFYGAKFQANF